MEPVRRWMLLSVGLVLVSACFGAVPRSWAQASAPPTVARRFSDVAPASPRSAAAVFTGLDMLTARKGWLVTTEGLWRTANGARSWRRVLMMKVLASAPGQASFAGAEDAWLPVASSGGRPALDRTLDAGSTWTRVHLPLASNLPPAFLNARRGWVLAGLNGLTFGRVIGQLLTTTDGGRRWSEIAATPGPGRPRGTMPLCCTWTGIIFTDRSTGWLAGTNPNVHLPLLYVTRDGGETWRHVALPVTTGQLAAEQAVVTSYSPSFFGQAGVLPVTFAGPKDDLLEFYITGDGGRRWQATAPLHPRGTALVWDAIGPQEVLVMSSGALYRMASGGTAWQLVGIRANMRPVVELDFLTPTLGFALTPRHVLKTVDGGKSWSQLAVS